jgi:hypothetical protein
MPSTVSGVAPVETVDLAATQTPLTPADRSSEIAVGELSFVGELSPPVHRAGLVDYIIGNRSRMIQIATLMMLLGLFILMRK